jgi:hypothetical protein
LVVDAFEEMVAGLIDGVAEFLRGSHPIMDGAAVNSDGGGGAGDGSPSASAAMTWTWMGFRLPTSKGGEPGEM